jgi:glycosyltransferase involved in cell wall biosynthesis
MWPWSAAEVPCKLPPQPFGANMNNQDIERHLAEAIKDHQQGRWTEAAKNYQRVIDADAIHPVALNNYSLLLNDAEAVALLTRALDAHPDYTDALVNLGVRHLNLGHIEEAQKFAERALESAPMDQKVEQLKARLKTVLPQKTEEQINNWPDFSVLIPTHRRPVLLARALQSIKQQVSSARHEIIVVSDCIDEKTDQTCHTWLGSTDTYIRRSGPPGPSASRNLALKMAKGRFILFLDDDDAWHPNFLEQLNRCETLKQGSPIYFNCSVLKESRGLQEPVLLSETLVSNQDRLTLEVFVKNQLSNSTLAFPREILSDIQFDTHMKAYEDWEFLLSVCERKFPTYEPILGPKIYEVDDSTTDRRGSQDNANNENAVLDYLYVYKKHPVNKSIRTLRQKLLESAGFNFFKSYL